MLNNRTTKLPTFAQSHTKHLVIAASLLGIIAGLVVAYLTCVNMLSLSAADLLATRTERQKEEVRVGELKAQKQAVRDTEGERARLESYFMNEKTVAVFLERLETLGHDLGLAATTVSLGVTDGVLHIAARASGAFAPLARYLSVVEEMPYKLRVERAAFSKDDEAWALTMEISVISFYSLH